MVESAQTISAGQELQVAGKVIGFVEGSPQFVILRIEGQNRKYEYPNLPPGLAMEIAEQGAKPDIPTYRLQKAAFFAIHSELDLTYGDKAKDLARQSEADGHDAGPIEFYVDYPLDVVGVPSAQLSSLSNQEIAEGLDELAINNADVRQKMQPDQAMAAVDTLLDASVATVDPKQRAIRVRAALLAARQTGDAFVMLDMVHEYALWVVIDFNEEIEAGLADIAKLGRSMSPIQKRRFVSLYNDYKAEFSDAQLARRLGKVAQRLQNSD